MGIRGLHRFIGAMVLDGLRRLHHVASKRLGLKPEQEFVVMPLTQWAPILRPNNTGDCGRVLFYDAGGAVESMEVSDTHDWGPWVVMVGARDGDPTRAFLARYETFGDDYRALVEEGDV